MSTVIKARTRAISDDSALSASTHLCPPASPQTTHCSPFAPRHPALHCSPWASKEAESTPGLLQPPPGRLLLQPERFPHRRQRSLWDSRLAHRVSSWKLSPQKQRAAPHPAFNPGGLALVGLAQPQGPMASLATSRSPPHPLPCRQRPVGRRHPAHILGMNKGSGIF